MVRSRALEEPSVTFLHLQLPSLHSVGSVRDYRISRTGFWWVAAASRCLQAQGTGSFTAKQLAMDEHLPRGPVVKHLGISKHVGSSLWQSLYQEPHLLWVEQLKNVVGLGQYQKRRPVARLPFRSLTVVCGLRGAEN